MANYDGTGGYITNTICKGLVLKDCNGWISKLILVRLAFLRVLALGSVMDAFEEIKEWQLGLSKGKPIQSSDWIMLYHSRKWRVPQCLFAVHYVGYLVSL